MLSENLLKTIFNDYELGKLINIPTLYTGGRTHHTYHLNTTLGQFVLKLFNMVPNQLAHYRNAEKIAYFFADKINAIAAIKNKHDDVILPIENVVACIYPHVTGRMIALGDSRHYHAEKIANALARIHQHQPIAINVAPVEIVNLSSIIEHSLAAKHLPVLKSHKMLQTMLDNMVTLTTQLQQHGAEDKECLLQNTVVSHRDCDHHNVLWNEQQVYYIIDWERAGLINRTKDVLVTSIYWSLSKKYIVQENLLVTFLASYQRNGLTIIKNEVHSAFQGFIHDWLGWFDFNLMRILESDVKDTAYLMSIIEEIKKTGNALPIVIQQRKKIMSCFA